MTELDELRNKIDDIDKSLIELFEKRMDCAKNVALYKKDNSASVLQSDREKQVIQKAMSSLNNKKLEGFIPRLMTDLMEMSKDYQRTIYDENVKIKLDRETLKENAQIGYFGAVGSNTQRAAMDFFNSNNVVSYESFEEVFKAVNEGEIDYGVLPIENSSTGAIVDVYDLLGKYNLYIIGEKWLRIRHSLLGVKDAMLEDVQEVYSHPQALSQCKEFLEESGYVQNFDTSTSAACERVEKLNSVHIAAVADPINVELYDLKILKEDIATCSENFTRFVIIGKTLLDKQSDKVSVHFVLKNDVGSLYNALRCFYHHNVNMIKIESRPIKNNPMNYSFYVDLEGNCNQSNMLMALQYLRQNCSVYKLLGEYKTGELE